jgi:hypothetical protein
LQEEELLCLILPTNQNFYVNPSSRNSLGRPSGGMGENIYRDLRYLNIKPTPYHYQLEMPSWR